MIAELVPGLEKLTREQKWLLVDELQHQLLADDPTEQEPLKSEIVAELESRYQHYLEHPETAVTLEQLSDKIRGLKK